MLKGIFNLLFSIYFILLIYYSAVTFNSVGAIRVVDHIVLPIALFVITIILIGVYLKIKSQKNKDS